MTKGEKILLRIKNKWRFYLWMELFVYATLAGVVTYPYGGITGASFALTAATVAALLLLKPWTPDVEAAVRLANTQLRAIHFSAESVLADPSDLTRLGQLQRYRVSGLLYKMQKEISVPFRFRRMIFVIVAISSIYMVMHYALLGDYGSPSSINEAEIVLIPRDHDSKNSHWPEVESLVITIRPPRYTGIPANTQIDPSLTVPEGSYAKWELTLSYGIGQVDLVTSGGMIHTLDSKGNVYTGSARLTKNGFYSFRSINGKAEHTSDLYGINIIPDGFPEVSLKNVKSYADFEYDQDKIIRVECDVTDDYGIQNVYLVATVSKGSGEAVKFREERLQFGSGWKRGGTRLALSRNIDLDVLEMGPGDELYFYAEAVDNRYPVPQKSRTETFFAMIKDTTEIEFSLAGSLGVDIMPGYFRSQRQLIIDTEKLIREKKTISTHRFNAASNELGYDQKALRIRYGQFMGEEFAVDLPGGTEETPAPDHDHDESDPLADFTHDHDGDNEHHLVADHDHATEEHDDDDVLHAYQHVHDDPEEATFFTLSVRQKLKQALTEMWDAELYLRLYQPEKSLPYQYKALRLLKEIKDHSRIYVHRIGFDPPPIKEESRLKGELGEVRDRSLTNSYLRKKPYLHLRRSLPLLQLFMMEGSIPNREQLIALEKAGDELAQLVILRPGQHLETLRSLRKIISSSYDPENKKELFQKTMDGIARALPDMAKEISGINYSEHSITRLFREKLDSLAGKGQ